MKKIFLHRNALAYKLEWVGTGLFAVCLCLLAGSCDKGPILGGEDGNGDPASVALQFSTSVDGQPAADVGDFKIGPESVVPGTPLLVEGTDFPGGTFNFGLFIESDGGTEVFPGSKNNAKGELTRTVSDSWKFYTAGSTTPVPSPVTRSSRALRVIAYWPYNKDATATGIPFDFTNISSTGQVELLYNKTQAGKIGPSGVMPLQFGHAYSSITLKISKSVAGTPLRIQSVSIINQSGKWIKNKGMINPATGYPDMDAQAGTITDQTMHADLATPDTSVDYKFLVPAFMSKNVADGDIAFKIIINDKETIFPLKKENLNTRAEAGVALYGFEQGCENTYDLVYDNLSLILKLRDWKFIGIVGSFGSPTVSDGTAGNKVWLFDFTKISPDLIGTLKAPISDHLYETYLLDQDRRGNGVFTAAWPDQTKNTQTQAFNFVWSQESPRSPIQFALEDALPTPVVWKSPEGFMTARILCKNYHEGGYSNWRLPRMSEWYMFERRIKTSPNAEYLYFPQLYGGTVPGVSLYWSGTESATNSVYDVEVIKLLISPTTIDITGSTLSPYSVAMVRCVRDV